MTKAVKTLIIVELLLSVGFCFVTLVLYANKQNFKQMYEEKSREYDAQVAAYNKLKEESEKKINELKAERDDAVKRLEDQKTRNEDLVRDLQDRDHTIIELKNNIDEYKAKIAEKDELLKQRFEIIKQQNEEIAKLKQEVEDATRNESDATAKVILLQDENAKLKLQIVNLNKELNAKQEELDEKKWIIQRLVDYGVPVSDIIVAKEKGPVKPIDGVVVAVREDVNLVMLSVGKDDGVKPGYMFTIYRGDKYIGKAKVEEVYNDMSSAMLIKKYMNKEGLKVQEGDNASTRVY